MIACKTLFLTMISLVACHGATLRGSNGGDELEDDQKVLYTEIVTPGNIESNQRIEN